MRTQDEIVARAKAGDTQDMFGFGLSVLVEYIDADHIKPLLKEDADPKGWESMAPTAENVLNDMKEYMKFAWEKAQNHRGLSASRSVVKMQAWLWLLGDEDLVAGVMYAQYGAPILRKICAHYGFPMPDDEYTKRMMAGLPCEDGCQQGCGG